MKEHQTAPRIQPEASSYREPETVRGGMWMMWICVGVMLLFALSLFWR